MVLWVGGTCRAVVQAAGVARLDKGDSLREFPPIRQGLGSYPLPDFGLSYSAGGPAWRGSLAVESHPGTAAPIGRTRELTLRANAGRTADAAHPDQGGFRWTSISR